MDNQNFSFKDIFIKGAVIFNPVLVQLAGLCPVIAAATTLENAALISVAFCAEIIVCCVFASAFLKKVPRWVRVPIHFLLGLLLVCPLLYYIESNVLIDLSLSMKIFIPVIAANSITAVHCEQFAVNNSVKLAFFDAASAGVGTSFVFLLTGALREILGNGTIGGFALDLPVTFRAVLMPFGSLLLLGFMAAVLKAIIMKKYPEYLAEGITFKSLSASKKPAEEVKEEIKENTEKILPEKQEIAVNEPVEAEIYDEFWAEQKTTEESIPETVVELPQEEEIKQENEIQLSDFDELFKSLELEIEKRMESDGQ